MRQVSVEGSEGSRRLSRAVGLGRDGVLCAAAGKGYLGYTLHGVVVVAVVIDVFKSSSGSLQERRCGRMAWALPDRALSPCGWLAGGGLGTVGCDAVT